MRFPVLALCALLSGLMPAIAQAESRRIESRSDFVALTQDRALTRLGITLTVSPDGRIAGRAFGMPVRGAWNWQGGYFCRSLFYGERDLGDNCQLVEQVGPALRFTADQGKGMYADLRLR